MKIRNGFVTNSSSTNFLIISKQEITAEYLYEKLGFKNNSPLRYLGMELCRNIVDGTSKGTRWFSVDHYDYESIKEHFGEKAAGVFLKIGQKDRHVYMGCTSDSDGCLTARFTHTPFEIEETDFYLNAMNSEY